MCGLDYSGIFKLLNIKQKDGKYLWRDHRRRSFETTNKRLVVVPYEMAAAAVASCGMEPKLVDVEPEWEDDIVNHETSSSESQSVLSQKKKEMAVLLKKTVDPLAKAEIERRIEILNCGKASLAGGNEDAPIPVAVVLGHVDHGKTTFLDRVRGTNVVACEPGSVTQDIRAVTVRGTPSRDVNQSAGQVWGPRSMMDRWAGRKAPGSHVDAFYNERGRLVPAPFMVDPATGQVKPEFGGMKDVDGIFSNSADDRMPGNAEHSYTPRQQRPLDRLEDPDFQARTGEYERALYYAQAAEALSARKKAWAEELELRSLRKRNLANFRQREREREGRWEAERLEAAELERIEGELEAKKSIQVTEVVSESPEDEHGGFGGDLCFSGDTGDLNPADVSCFNDFAREDVGTESPESIASETPKGRRQLLASLQKQHDELAKSFDGVDISTEDCNNFAYDSDPRVLLASKRAQVKSLMNKDLSDKHYRRFEEDQKRENRPKAVDEPLDYRPLTWIDTPGHEIFEIMRGRTCSVADVAVVLVDSTKLEASSRDNSTEELLLHAEKWRVPVIFVLSKCDLLSSKADHSKLRSKLTQLCQRLHKQKRLEFDWGSAAEKAILASGLTGFNVSKVVDKVHEVAAAEWKNEKRRKEKLFRPRLSDTPGMAASTALYTRRTDFLRELDVAPSSVAIVLEVEKSASRGTLITLLVKCGTLRLDEYFVLGSAFGRVTSLLAGDDATACGGKSVVAASAGSAVRIVGAKTKSFGGDFANGDIFLGFGTSNRTRAFRIHQHRVRIEALAGIQTSGPKISTCWEFEGDQRSRIECDEIGIRGMENKDLLDLAEDGDSAVSQDDMTGEELKSTGTGYGESRNKTAVEEFGGDLVKDKPVFSNRTRSVFERPIAKQQGIVVPPFLEEQDIPSSTSAENRSGKEISNCSTGTSTATCGRRSRCQRDSKEELRARIEEKRRKRVAEPHPQHAYYADKFGGSVDLSADERARVDEATLGGFHSDAGRSMGGEVDAEALETLRDSVATTTRWSERDEKRREQQEEARRLEEEERLVARSIRRRFLGLGDDVDFDKFEKKREKEKGRRERFEEMDFYKEREKDPNMRAVRSKITPLPSEDSAPPSQNLLHSGQGRKSAGALHASLVDFAYTPNSSNDSSTYSAHRSRLDPGSTPDELGTPSFDIDNSRPVISVMLKTKNIGIFDACQDELAKLETKHGVRLPLVHGGVGPVSLGDITHVEVEKKYGYSPLYCFQVPVHRDAQEEVKKLKLELRHHRVVKDLVRDIEERCLRVEWAVQKRAVEKAEREDGLRRLAMTGS